MNAAMRVELPSTLPATSAQPDGSRGPSAIIPIVGVLMKYASPDTGLDAWFGFTPARSAMFALSTVASNPKVKQTSLLVDSPGGLIAGANEMAEMVAQVNKSKPVDAVVSDCCCCAAYMIASQCRSITANRFAEIGSIGVLCVLCDTLAADANAGLRFVTVSSSESKGLGADGKVTDALIAELQRTIIGQHALFDDRIVTGRTMNAAAVEKLADSHVWLAEVAMSLGLIDSVGAADAAMAQLSANAMPRGSTAKASKPPTLSELVQRFSDQQNGK